MDPKNKNKKSIANCKVWCMVLGFVYVYEVNKNFVVVVVVVYYFSANLALSLVPSCTHAHLNYRLPPSFNEIVNFSFLLGERQTNINREFLCKRKNFSFF